MRKTKAKRVRTISMTLSWRLPVDDVEMLEVGDILMLEPKQAMHVHVLVDGKPRWQGELLTIDAEQQGGPDGFGVRFTSFASDTGDDARA